VLQVYNRWIIQDCKKLSMLLTCTVIGDLQGPSNLIPVNRNVLPPGTIMVGRLLSLQAACHVLKNACWQRRRQKPRRQLNVGEHKKCVFTFASSVSPSPNAWKFRTSYTRDCPSAHRMNSKSSSVEKCFTAVIFCKKYGWLQNGNGRHKASS
jgi:hypothetical protein